MRREVTSRVATPRPVSGRESAQSAPGARAAQAWNYVRRHAARQQEASSPIRAASVGVCLALPESRTETMRYGVHDRACALVASERS